MRQSFVFHARDRARGAKRRGLFTTPVTGCPARCQWGPSPLISHAGSSDAVEPPGRRTNAPTTPRCGELAGLAYATLQWRTYRSCAWSDALQLRHVVYNFWHQREFATLDL
jgi:hypothetical protein